MTSNSQTNSPKKTETSSKEKKVLIPSSLEGRTTAEFPFTPDCTLCELHAEATNPGVGTVYLPTSLKPTPTTDALLFVGQNPGFNEDQQNEPFIGLSGQKLKQAYIGGVSLGDLASIYLTNGVRCYTPGNIQPRPKHFRACSVHLNKDLLDICRIHRDARIGIVCVGAPATTSVWKELFGISKVTLTEGFNRNGHTHTFQSRPITLFSVYHPAAVLRDRNKLGAVVSHMQIVQDWLNEVMATPSKPNIVPPRPPRKPS